MIPTSRRPSPAAEVARRHSERTQLQEIRERFSSYIGNVRSMRNQLTQGDQTPSNQSLREEADAVRNQYEQRVAELQEKLEQSYREGSRDHHSTVLQTEYHSRLLEMTADILKKDEQIRALQLALAQQESNIQSLKGAAVTPSIQRDLAKQELRELQRNLLMAQTKYEDEFSQRLALQEQVQELTLYMEDLKQIHRQETQDLRTQIAQLEGLVLQLEDRLHSMSREGPALMETVQRIQEASEAEVKRLQNEAESAYNQNILELQMRLNNDQILLGQAQEEGRRLQQRVEEVAAERTALEKKLFSEESNNRTLMEKLELEQMNSLRHIRALEARLEELQDLLLAKMKELSTFQESNLSLRGELDALRSMLEEEEQLMSSSNLRFLQSAPSSSHLLSQSVPCSANILFHDYSGVTGVTPPNTTSPPTQRSTAVSSYKEGNISKLNEELPVILDDKHDQPEEFTRCESAPAVSGQTPERSASRGSSVFRVDSVNPGHTGITPPPSSRDMKTAVSSAIGHLEISEVDPSGKFVRIANRSADTEEVIGGFLLQQNVGGHPVSVYRFPPKARVMASCTVTIWTSSAGVAHNPPTDLLFKEQSRFVTELRCTTILCTPNGQALAWSTPIRHNMRASQEQYMPEVKAKPSSPVQPPEQPKEEAITGGKIQSLPAQNRVKKASTLLKRDKISLAALPVSSSPWTQSTAAPTHPDFTPSRLVPLGSEGNSLCRQERSQTAKTDPPSAGIPSAGLRHGRDPVVSSASRKSRGPTRSAGVGKGTLRLLLPGSFAPPSAQHQMGLQILQSVQNLHFQPPMPRPPADREP